VLGRDGSKCRNGVFEGVRTVELAQFVYVPGGMAI